MLRKFFAIGMLGCILLQTLVGSMWVLRYYAQKTEYTAHCENRDKPQMQCHGKCLLKKELQKLDACARGESSDEPQKAPAAPLKTKAQYELSVFMLPAAVAPSLFYPFYTSSTATLFWYAVPAGRLWSGDIFHPPATSIVGGLSV